MAALHAICFPVWTRVLPKDIVFSALDNIDPSWEPNVSQFYGKLPADRERWAIPWWESDGGGSRHDQFMPQCNVKPFSVLLPDVIKKGCKGVLGIHWRSRGVEDVARLYDGLRLESDEDDLRILLVRFRHAVLRRGRRCRR